MKRIKVLCVLLLAVCGLSQALTQSAAELNTMESAFSEANLSSVLAAKTPPMLAAQQNPHWRFAAQQGLSLTGNPYLALEVEPATDDLISVEVQNDSEAAVKGASSGNALALSVSARGGSRVILHVPEKIHYLMLKTFNAVQGHLARQLLYLNLDGCNNVDLKGGPSMLEYLRIAHASHVTLSLIKTPYLLASITDSSSIKIHGVINLRELNVQNSQAVEWYWLNSPILNLHAMGQNSVLLAGKVVYANMKLEGDTRLDAKYLETNRLFVKTSSNATAEVRASDALNALATGHSNIYYYSQPSVLSRYYRDSGSVLYRGEKPPACDLAYCPPTARVLPG